MRHKNAKICPKWICIRWGGIPTKHDAQRHKSSDTPTFSIAERTQTDHFSLSLRKLPNQNRPEPTLKSCTKTWWCDRYMFVILKIHDTHLINVYNCMHLIKWVSVCSKKHLQLQKCALKNAKMFEKKDHLTVRSTVILYQNQPNSLIVRNLPDGLAEPTRRCITSHNSNWANRGLILWWNENPIKALWSVFTSAVL